MKVLVSNGGIYIPASSWYGVCNLPTLPVPETVYSRLSRDLHNTYKEKSAHSSVFRFPTVCGFR
jgi:hypothetical protein